MKDVDNRIGINYAATRSDTEIRNDILARLESSVWIESGLIEVAVTGGDVELSGIVGSAAARVK